MKKFIMLVLCAIYAMMLTTGCADSNEAFASKSYASDSAEVTEVHIDVRDREIEVLNSKDNQIHIEYYESSKETYDISVSDDNVLTMTSVSNKEWKDFIGSKSPDESRKIILKVPDSILSVLSLTTTNEDIVLSPMAVTGDISISANGGNITFDNVNAGNALNLSAKNGDIRGSISGGYDDYAIVCKIKKGNSNLPNEKKDGAKTLQVSNNNGNIKIEFVKDDLK